MLFYLLLTLIRLLILPFASLGWSTTSIRPPRSVGQSIAPTRRRWRRRHEQSKEVRKPRTTLLL
jgi:hypothetical protein